MDLLASLSDLQLNNLNEHINDWFFLAMMLLLVFELFKLLLKGQLRWNLLADCASNFATLIAFQAIGFALYGLFYLASYFWVFENASLTQLPTNWLAIGVCILLADFIYYWEHRFMHRCGLGWATHTVHHSSPYFNISVAYRFGPLDAFFPFFFHLPLVMLGFHPLLVFLAEALVQLYQTALHTELLKKLPKPIEAIFNTPSHYRAHHARNREYLDKNYAGIFIIWDKIFGTFAEEQSSWRKHPAGLIAGSF